MNVAGIAAIMGRTLGWGSSFTGALPKVTGTAYADNPMDMTSDGNQGALHVGTIAVNRYAAGWITPEQVHIYDGGADQVVLNVDWEPGAQMIVLALRRTGTLLVLGSAGSQTTRPGHTQRRRGSLHCQTRMRRRRLLLGSEPPAHPLAT